MAQADIGNKLSDTRTEGDDTSAAQERLGDYKLPREALSVVEAADREIEAAHDQFRPQADAVDPDAELREHPLRAKKVSGGDNETPIREQREKSPPARYGNVEEPPQFVRKSNDIKATEEERYIQGTVPVSHSLRENLSQDAVAHDPDFYSTYNVTPQPD